MKPRKDSPVTVDVLANDQGLDDGPLTVIQEAAPNNGSIVVEVNNRITYTPDPDFNGVDNFDYRVTDTDAQFAVATVTVTVTPVNDTPVAAGETVGVPTQATPVTIDVLANDSGLGDGGIVVAQETAPGDGAIVVELDKKITYTPDGGFAGVDTFSYRVTDGDGEFDVATVTVVVGTVTQSFALKKGWNLIAFCMNPTDTEPATVFADAGGSVLAGEVWTFNTANGKMETVAELAAGIGYWVFVAVDVTVSDIPGSPVANTNLPVSEGWNLRGPVGVGADAPLPGADAGVTAPVYFWRAVPNRFGIATKLKKGVGVWINIGPGTDDLDLRLTPQ